MKYLAIAVLLLAGCAAGTSPINTPDRPSEVVASARVVVTAGVNTADSLFLAGKITKAQGEQVLSAAKTAQTLLNLADAYAASGNATSAQTLLSGPQYTSAFGIVAAFLSAHPATP